ncbi:hypothetical protein FN846DRAFT_399162 [Sphaerosporella brunnea]|uniref:Uncharacterized protein n=1 Tax=Sphaerosporella brunnea TaxID=1250544 RepID=A0A5J5EI88_9PEZI|nr:hypothetical protein FN846DRAFT_399162 [Sphaerosporella brunnea]
MDLDRPSNTESSPYHWASKPSDDLLGSPATSSPRNSRNLTPGQKSTPNHSHTDSLGAPKSSTQKRNSGETGLKRSSTAYVDEDAMVVANSVRARPQPNQTKSSPAAIRRLSDKSKDRDSGWEETSSSDHSLRSSGSSRDTALTSPTMSRGNTETYGKLELSSSDATLKAKQSTLVGVQLTDEPVEDDLDGSFTAAAALAAKYESEPSPKQAPTNRVMTRAQFERIQQQQDDQRRLSGKGADDDDDDSDVSDYEEEAEIEKTKELARQRARQEAHLSVYRQQMMKMSGTDPSDVPLLGMNRPGSVSTSALPLMDPGSSEKNSDEEDEEVPLGILMAHGFPTKNRPPTRLSNASSQPNLRAMAQSQQLPVFARNLPQDPYNVGASLVNPMNRMPLSFGVGSDARSVAGGSMYNGMPPSQPPPGRGPGGLVGEIVRAEEQKAFRRGLGGTGAQYMPSQPQIPSDPFKQDPFDRPASRGGGGLLGNVHSPMGMQGNGTMGGMMGGNMGMGGMGMGGMGGMGMGGMGMGMSIQQDQTHAQMAAMQQQYMQMHMQMMQMQLQMQNNAQQQMMSPMMPMMGQQSRPSSMMSMQHPMGSLGGGLGVPQASQQRAMSMVGGQFPQLPPLGQPSYAPSIAPSMGGGNGFLGPPQGYTPSIAPSERSTIGQPSRYRPVSYAPGSTAEGRTNTLTSGSAGADWNRKSHVPSRLGKSAVDDDEDDESGWAELNKKRQEKADDWKRKKEGGLKSFGSGATSSNGSSAP